MGLRAVGAVLAAAACLACGRAPIAAPPPNIVAAAPPADPWVLTCTDPNEPDPALLWNGKIGVRIGRDGTGCAAKVGTLPFFRIDTYQSVGEEKIHPLIHPLAIRTMVDGGPLDALHGGDYIQRLDMKTGILTSSWTERLPRGTMRFEVQDVVDPFHMHLAQRWTINGSGGASVNQSSTLVGNTIKMEDVASSTGPGRWKWTHERWSTPGAGGHVALDVGTDSDTGAIFHLRRPDQPSISVQAGKAAHIEWIFDLEPHSDRPPLTAKQRSAFAYGTQFEYGNKAPVAQEPFLRFDDVARASISGFKKRWQTDIVVDGPAEDQQAIHSFLFYLRSAISPDGKMSVSPFGLSNQAYNGHVFWDADTWVFPALAFLDPSEARAIADYRVRMVPAAAENFAKLGEKGSGLRYPWESSVSGRETAAGPSVDELHISGDVAWAASLAAALGLESPADAQRILEGVGSYYTSISRGPPKERTIGHVLSADEYWYVNNDLYTNLLAQWTTNGGRWDGSERYKLPADKFGLLSYDGDRLMTYKQAAALLGIYPLQYPPAEAMAGRMMDRFAGKVTPNGPAMSQAINSIIWARQGETRKAYAAWRASWRPYTTAPFLLFSEKTMQTSTYFTTGAAGALQAVLYGFLGFRLDYKREPGATWSRPLGDGTRWLSIKPNLPNLWKSVKLKNFTVLGQRYNLIATRSRVTVTPATGD
jgi:trehalose/maltose hydrolase-like predicted phosphorylase